jgi:large subunit ribosomal protein L15
MNLRDVYSIRVPRTERRRLGRGWGSGIGKTSGRGEKGAGRRSGTKFRMRFEGGQMPLYRRLPKKGFTNHAFRVRFEGVNVGDLERAFEAGKTVDLEALRGALLVPKTATLWKLLGDGALTKSMVVKCDAASAGAKEKVEKAGGRLELVAGPVRARQEAVALHRERLATTRAAAVEALREEAKKAGKPKKAAAGGKAAKAAKPKAPAGAGKPPGGGKPAGAQKPPASKKEQS